jgi:hypothetical protein
MAKTSPGWIDGTSLQLDDASQRPLPALLTVPGLGSPAQRQVPAWLQPAQDPAGSQIPVQPVERVAGYGNRYRA